ncbi:LysM peptidoglycan-binding domain-containing protein [Microbacterium sp. P03]|uniref:muramidase family protein n=1 Tax=Microbacterium sp. P03 TaxID=3366946 RepID=UPI003745E2D0
MRPPEMHRPPARPNPMQNRAFGIGVPAVIVGSLAMSLTAMPAHAAGDERAHARETPRSGVHPVATGSHAAVSARVQSAVAPDTYTVSAGDTVSAIAGRFDLRTADVLAINGLSRSSVIYPGQVLRLNGAVAAAPASAAPATPPAASGSYTVAAGDTISAIARAHGTSIQAVLDANGLTRASIIYPGQALALPGSVAATASAPAAVVPASAPAVTSGAYTVEAGDTISAIASRHGTTTRAILDANGLTTASIIYPGQSIALPAAGMVAAASVTPLSAAASSSLDAEQAANAQLIIRVGREMGVPDRGITIALGTAMQESWLRNLDWGDRDSLGLFQQRPSMGWGSADQVRDGDRAARAFFGGPSDPNGSTTRGLLDIAGWQSMSFADAAQAVQISAYPDRYAQWEQPASSWLAALG